MIILGCIPNYPVLEDSRDTHKRKLHIFAKNCPKVKKLNSLFHLEKCVRTFLLRTKCQILFDPLMFINLHVLTVMLVM